MEGSLALKRFSPSTPSAPPLQMPEPVEQPDFLEW